MKLDRRGLTLIELMVAMLILLILMAVLASFVLSTSMATATSRRSAWNGQAVERALTMLRQELAGTEDFYRDVDDSLVYSRIRDGEYWAIMVEDGNLVRRHETSSEVIIMAKDVNSFEFILPIENLDPEGYLIDPNMIWVIVGAGNFKLDDAIYLRNYSP